LFGRLNSFSFAGALAALAILSAAPASAGTIVYDFTGTCTDCYSGSGNATGELTLLDTYQLGQAITSGNFVSFHYDGTNLLSPFTISLGDTNLFLSGSMSTVPGFDTVSFNSVNGTFLADSASGNWCAGPGCASDQGGNGIFTGAVSTPEPGSIGLVLTGLAAMLWRAKRR